MSDQNMEKKERVFTEEVFNQGSIVFIKWVGKWRKKITHNMYIEINKPNVVKAYNHSMGALI